MIEIIRSIIIDLSILNSKALSLISKSMAGLLKELVNKNTSEKCVE